MTEDWGNQERRVLYGRRQGHKLKGRQADLMARLLPLLQVDLQSSDCAAPQHLFTPVAEEVWLEIGFGGGEHLAASASANPATGIIGAEPFINGIAKLLAEIEDRKLCNVRIHPEDARDLLDRLGAQTISRIFLLYPDPWPKKRHNKRRFIARDNLQRLHKVLKPGGIFLFASDIPDYVRWTLFEIMAHGGFEWCAARPDDWRLPPKGWPGTRYEAKALREGRVPVYLTFRRI
jgi:tRNA (guanine-N7-)-methyltransferase